MSFLSKQEHVSDGTLDSVLLTIPFLDKEHLLFYIGGAQIDFVTAVGGVRVNTVTNTQVTLSGPVPNGTVFRVLRQTPRVTVTHLFNNGAALFNAVNTDENNTALLYIVQEAYEQSSIEDYPDASQPLTGEEFLVIQQAGVGCRTTLNDLVSSLTSDNNALLVGLSTADLAAYFNSLG